MVVHSFQNHKQTKKQIVLCPPAILTSEVVIIFAIIIGSPLDSLAAIYKKGLDDHDQYAGTFILACFLLIEKRKIENWSHWLSRVE